MDPNIWGPKFWFSLHSVTFTYPFYPDEADKERYKTFFNLLEYVLPCVVCRVNYSKNIRSHPIDAHLKDRKALVNWAIDIHNMVNVENGKPVISYDEAMMVYEKAFGRKIHLEDPEPEVSKGKKLDDATWKKNYENKTFKGKFKNKIFPMVFPLIVLLFFFICVYCVYKFTKNL